MNGHCFGCGTDKLDPMKTYYGAVGVLFVIFCSEECYKRWLRNEEEKQYAALKVDVDAAELEMMCKTFVDARNITDEGVILNGWDDMPEDDRAEVRRAMRITVDFILSHIRG